MDTEGRYVVTPAGCRMIIDKCNTGLLNAASYAAEMGDEAMRLAKAADAAVAALRDSK